MPTNSDRVLAYLASHPEGQDDDQIAAAVNIDRVQINAICRRLAAAGAIDRGAPSSGAKILNQAISPRTDAESSALPASNPHTGTPSVPQVTYVGPIVWLADSQAAQQFAYSGDVGLAEDQVKAAIQQALEAHGWQTEVRWGHTHGIDIEAIQGDERFVLEAKGEGFTSPARSVNFDAALGELIRRMNAPDARYGLALPAHRQFMGLVARLPLWIRQRLNLWFFFVRPHEHAMEVGVFPPDRARNSL